MEIFENIHQIFFLKLSYYQFNADAKLKDITNL